MRRSPRPRPERLAEKLRQIRETLQLSQSQVVAHLGLTDVIYRNNVSGFETGERLPYLPILLLYARAAGVCMDVLVDDELDLPDQLPSVPQHKGVKMPGTPGPKPKSAPKGKR